MSSVQKHDHPSLKLIATGISGVGKTTLAEKLAKRERAKWIFIYDHKGGDFARRLGVRGIVEPDQLEAAAERGGLVIFNPAKHFAGKKEEGFEFFCEWVWAISQQLRGKKVLLVDELQSLVDSYSKPEFFLKILDEGRSYQLDVVCIAAAMNGIHNQVRKQFTEIFAFLQGDKVSTDWLVEKGFPEKELLSLKYGQWLYKNLITGTSKSGGKAFVPKDAERNLTGL